MKKKTMDARCVISSFCLLKKSWLLCEKYDYNLGNRLLLSGMNHSGRKYLGSPINTSLGLGSAARAKELGLLSCARCGWRFDFVFCFCFFGAAFVVFF